MHYDTATACTMSQIVVTAYDGATGDLAWNAIVGVGTALTLFLFSVDDFGNVFVGYVDNDGVSTLQ